ncbi:MAG: CCDC90 family protein [Chitinophagales bacterium]|nr:CCDC90 family protein [Chitinophagales bacterium]
MEFATLHMDTYRIVQLLEEKGYSKDQAEGFMQAVQEISLTGVATRQDIAEVKKEIADVEGRVKQEIAQVKIDLFKFMFMNSLAIVGLTVTLIKLLG